MTTASPASRIFCGWWIVLGCGIVAVVGWSLAIFGMGVYIHVLSEQRGLSIGLISTAVTFSFLVNAACLTSAGTVTARFGARPVILTGAAAMAIALSGLGYFDRAWAIFLMFAVLGVGRACLSATTISTTLAPWFERHQGRAVSTALLGASVGGMIATPLLLGGIALYGVTPAFALAGSISAILLLPVALWVIKRTPQELGLLPDGGAATSAAPIEQAKWTLRGAMATRHFRTQLAAFALAQGAQVGFLSHHVSIVAPFLGESGASLAVSLAALAAFGGRIVLARFADKVDLRLLTGGVMLVAGISLGYLGLSSSPVFLAARQRHVRPDDRQPHDTRAVAGAPGSRRAFVRARLRLHLGRDRIRHGVRTRGLRPAARHVRKLRPATPGCRRHQHRRGTGHHMGRSKAAAGAAIGHQSSRNFSQRPILTVIAETGGSVMNGIIYLIGLVVVIGAILSFLGLR